MGINRVEPYEALADVYQVAGFTNYAAGLAQSLLSIAFDLNWTGKTLIDLGCGIGELAVWFGGRQIRSLGVDSSPSMIRVADAKAIDAHVDVTFAAGDIRTYAPTTAFDLAVCIGGTVNLMPTLRDVEALFRVAHTALSPRKLFFFDLRTIQGLAKTDAMRILANTDEVFIATTSSFNFETLALTSQYTILRDGESGWTRAEETHISRGYTAQTVARLLQNAGFRLLQTITPNSAPLDAQHHDDMLLFVAIRD
ncbi:MAG: class I SAM-dependent methyltransferase [Anaerolineae bacterium]|nr:class I SAM-dependent methyltransferase [Anaerolineae bacterium]